MTTPRRGRPPSGGREQILTATYELLRDKGIARLTTKEIAERAGTSEGSIFYHYGTRDGLLSAVFEHALAPLVELRAQGVGTRPLPETLDTFTATVEQFLERAVVVMFAAQADVDLRAGLHGFLAADADRRPQRGIDLIGDHLTALQEAGRIRAGIDVRAATFLLVSSCLFRVSHPWLIGDTDVPSRETILATFLAMLAP
ncbi:TetR/AcrR family transcriptional regulator [Nocardia sp. NPDC050718]|uniref:TetR/AcrR family transcriptional regulator n=1 Tax=Nocardia sp. NPDC050718 TaxID=3155788 RepID=UPI0033F5DA49